MQKSLGATRMKAGRHDAGRYSMALCTAALIAMIAGCAGLPPAASPENAPAAERRYSDAIELGGRLSLRYQQNGADQAVHGSFTWNQQAQHVVLSLLSPLGQTLATIDIRPGVAVLTQAGKPPMSAADVDMLTEQALGWPLPIAGLRDWLQGFGRGTDGVPFAALPAREPSRFVTSDGWHLSYGEWQDDAAQTLQNHPRRIDLARHTEQAGAVSIRIVIDSWQGH